MSDIQFLKLVNDKVKENPSVLGDLFKIVSDNWDAMVKAQSMKRESSHLSGLADMIDNLYFRALWKVKDPRPFTNAECCTLLEACDAVMPLGVGGSVAQKAIMKHLAASCHALGWKPEDDFITKVRNKRQFLTNLYEANND